MDEYTCYYLIDATHQVRDVYHAHDLSEAMASHNDSKPEFSDKVVKWVGPTGITYQMHDKSLSLNS